MRRPSVHPIAAAAAVLLVIGAAGCAPRIERRGTSEVIIDRARFTVIAPECIRMEYSGSGDFVDAPSHFAAERRAASPEFTVTRANDVYSILTDRMILEYRPDGAPFHEQNLVVYVRREQGDTVWRPGDPNPGNLGGTIRTLDGVTGPVPLGEGVLSRDGWVLVDDSASVLHVDGWAEERPDPSAIDWYFFGYGQDYRAALRALMQIGGFIPLPRRYSLGVWYSRYWDYTSDDYRAIVEGYREHGFPLDVMVLDMDWHRDGWTGWSWNRELLPDAEALLADLHEEGLAVTLNLHPADGVGPHEDAYPAFMRALGRDPASGETVEFDAGDRRYVEALFDEVLGPLEEAGVDFWWLDWQQYPYTRSIPTLTNLAWLNHRFTEHTRRGGLRGQSFSRWGGWGDHRHPIHFSGDAGTNWESLAFEVPFTATAGNVGCFFWSHDIGGHMGDRNTESYARWTQLGAVSAALRSHSTRSEELDRRPWKWRPWATDAMRRAFHLRSELFPYIYTAVRQACVESVPLHRPMYIEHPSDERAYRNPQQLLFGDAFLVAPIVEPGVGARRLAVQDVWFPEGIWYQWFTGERHEGDLETIVTADIDEFPLFVRGGVPVPLQPYTERMATTPLSELVVRCFPGPDGETGTASLYEDDGVTRAYERGEWAMTPLVYAREGDSVSVRVGPTEGSFDGQVDRRTITIELPGTAPAIEVGGTETIASHEYEDGSQTNRIRLAGTDIRKEAWVHVRLAPGDADALAESPRLLARGRRIDGVLRGVPEETEATATDGEADHGEVFEIADDAAREEAVRAVFGLALRYRNEDLHLLPGRRALWFHDAEGGIDDGRVRLRVVDASGTEERVVHDAWHEVSPGAPVRVELPPLAAAPDRIGARPERRARAELVSDGAPVVIERALEERPSHVRRWQLSGPLPYDREGELAAQGPPPGDGGMDVAGPVAGTPGASLEWTPVEADETGRVDIRAVHDADDSLAYALAVLHSDEAQPVRLAVQSDDGVQIWLNGEEVHLADEQRPMTHDPEIVEGRLRAGDNRVLLKISNGIGGWAFRLGIETATPLRDRAP